MEDLSLFLAVLAGLSRGVGVTVLVAVCSLAMGVSIGFALALLRRFAGSRLLDGLIGAYVEFFRNIPALTHLFVLYFGLASIGIRLQSVTAAILGLGLIGGSVTADIFGASFKSLPKGQAEAALAVGLSPLQAIFAILTPQAMRIALPPLGNYAVQLLKDTSVVSAIAAPEIMFYARGMVTSSFQTTLIYVTAAALYLLLSLPLMRGVRFLEDHYARVR